MRMSKKLGLPLIETGKSKIGMHPDGLTVFKAVVESIADGVVILNRDGQIMYVNPALRKMAGVMPEELLGKTIGEIPPMITPEAMGILAERVKERLVTGEPVTNVEIEGVNKEGKRLPITYSASVIKGRTQ